MFSCIAKGMQTLRKLIDVSVRTKASTLEVHEVKRSRSLNDPTTRDPREEILAKEQAIHSRESRIDAEIPSTTL